MLDRPDHDLVGVQDDLDEIDNYWWWSEGTIDEAASIFKLAAGLVPDEFEATLTMIVLLASSSRLKTCPVIYEELEPDAFFPPHFHLNRSAYHARAWPAGGEEYRSFWAADPWGVADSRTQVSFVSWRPTVDGPIGSDFQNQVRFTRYPGSGGTEASALPGMRPHAKTEWWRRFRRSGVRTTLKVVTTDT
jgi:hypothetical protein